MSSLFFIENDSPLSVFSLRFIAAGSITIQHFRLTLSGTFLFFLELYLYVTYKNKVLLYRWHLNAAQRYLQYGGELC